MDKMFHKIIRYYCFDALPDKFYLIQKGKAFIVDEKYINCGKCIRA
jgi:hypothetical protein